MRVVWGVVEQRGGQSDGNVVKSSRQRGFRVLQLGEEQYKDGGKDCERKELPDPLVLPYWQG